MSTNRTAALLSFVALMALLGACAKTNTAVLQTTPTPSPTVIDDALYAFRLPAGWTRTSTKTDEIGRTDWYEDGQGTFLNVHIFPDEKTFGSDYASDTTWELAFTADRSGFTVKKKDPTCTPSPENGGCTAGDGKLDVYALVRGNENVFVRGNAFQFSFGNARAETGVDTTVFEEMIESFRIK